jgi:hypothetical protein
MMVKRSSIAAWRGKCSRQTQSTDSRQACLEKVAPGRHSKTLALARVKMTKRVKVRVRLHAGNTVVHK